MVAQLEGTLRGSQGFRRLEEIVEKLHSMIALKSCVSLSEADKDLIHQLFKIKPGQFEGLNQSLAEMKTENSQLHLELQRLCDLQQETLLQQKDYLKCLSDFSKGILLLDDRHIQTNYNLTAAKRNRAPMFADIASKVESIDQQISELRGKKLDNQMGDPEGTHQFANASNHDTRLDRRSSSSTIEFILPEPQREQEHTEYPRKQKHFVP